MKSWLRKQYEEELDAWILLAIAIGWVVFLALNWQSIH